MSELTGALARTPIVYPDSDGQPMAENTLQFEWISTLKWGFEALYGDRADVFVAGDLLWYPVEGDNTLRTAPDVLIAFGRPKGYRGSYMQWREGGIAPQVVFEILSPGKRAAEVVRKFRFYERYEVEEYYAYDPDRAELAGWIRSGSLLEEVPAIQGFASPRLGTRFDLTTGQLLVLGPDGRAFATYLELVAQRDEAERQRAESERRRAETEERAERLAARLRQLGVDPES